MKRLCFTLLMLVAVLAIQAQDTTQVSYDHLLLQTPTPPASSKIKLMGYRVQVYYGGNDHKAKTEAYKMANRANMWFDNHKVYTFFQSPHWKCQVGNFRTRKEAAVLLSQMRENGRFPEAVIVKTRIVMSRKSYQESLMRDSLEMADENKVTD